ncbi:hypothetical protein [Pukyongiella litopenaei]|uniref:hypothetical protein n=1 Tax=Pukyongiella litopenaei TaxID=2605946 RepID=UPI001B8076D4|nr:hypothetical protein [Pukyongiella litopenaei]
MDTRITLTLDDPLLRAARDVADRREITIQQLLKDALKTELARAHRKAKSPVRADERLIAVLRARLAEDFAYARDWFDLIDRLRNKGVVLREAGGGLAVFAAPTGARLCKASDIGFSLNRLAQNFRAPFPGDKLGRRDHYVSTTPAWDTRVIDEIEF